ncbi:MAG: GlsB/YeaQ/YmgE family stress response membrane protein [Bacteroidota bacterium]
MIWSLLVWAAFGLVAGLIAKAIFPGKEPGGLFVTMLIGIGGAILGGWIGRIIGIASDGRVSFLSPRDWIVAVLGALLILYIWKRFIAK